MTALTVAARPEQDDGPRPMPWRRMAWVTWRQHRSALAGVAVFIGAIAVCVWIAGLQLHHAYDAAIAACQQPSSLSCLGPPTARGQIGGAVGKFDGMYDFLANGGILQAVPVLIGAFVGAPVLARELETGTFRYAWTQGYGRWRWTLGKLVLLAIAVAVAAGALSVLLSWYYQPYFNPGNQSLELTETTPFFPALFSLRGVAFAGWALVAFAIAGLAGMLIRRVVPAIAATLAVYAGLAFATGTFLREHYLSPLVTSNLNVPVTAWTLGQWSTKNGKFAFAGFAPDSLIRQLCPGPPAGVRPGPNGKPKEVSLAECLSQHGYTQWTSYHPASQFWAFQGIEAGWLLALSALLIAATVWLVRRRAA